MQNWYAEPRHWTPQEGYATGDVLVHKLRTGWDIADWQPASDGGPAPMFIVTLRRGEERLPLLVLDGPAVRTALAPQLIPAAA